MKSRPGVTHRYRQARMDVESAIRTRRTHKAFAPDPIAARAGRRAARAGALGAEPSPDEPVAVPSPGAGRARGPEGRRRSGGGLEARPRPDAGRDDRPSAPRIRSRIRRTCVRPRARSMRSCSPRTAAVSRVTGGLRACSGSPPGLEALGIPPSERFVALIHLGWPRQEREPPERLPTADVVTYLP